MEDCDGMLCRLEVIYPNRLHIMHVHLVADTLDPGQPGGEGGLGALDLFLKLSGLSGSRDVRQVLVKKRLLCIHISIRYME